MKFGRKISNDLYSEWRPFYIDYNLLKRELKARTTAHNWDAADELEFTNLLEGELDKIHDFQKAKTTELSNRIKIAEKQVKKLVSDDFIATPSPTQRHALGSSVPDREDPEASRRRDTLHQDGGSDDDDTDDEEGTTLTDDGSAQSLDALEEQFHFLEEEVATLVADVHDLALYTKLNITGFMKILKKHDKQTPTPLTQAFIQNYLEKRPFYKYNWDAIIVKLSRLYDLVRTRGHPVQGDSSAGGSQSAFVRQTTKYWVHPDNLVPLKLAIMRHLPVLVFNPDKEFEPKDSAITSIYFDNEDLELYLGRLEKTEGAQAIRLRWYGDTNISQIFVERKTHREDWTGEKSVKARFPIKEDKVNAFLRGEYTMDEEFAAIVKKGKKSQADVDSMLQLANEVQYAVLTRHLQPVMRTFYNRTAFQLPGDARVRISLDTELTMVREDNWDGRVRTGDNWRRTDIGIDWPFEQLLPEDRDLFKYGVLEVKLQTQYGQEPPQWVTELVNSHLVEAVPKFSKFIHGCATLLPHRVNLVPFWLPQMDVDITKPDTGFRSVERPYSQRTPERRSSGAPTPDPGDSERATYVEPLSEGEGDEDMDMAPARDEGARIGLGNGQAADAIAFREKQLKERAQPPGPSRARSIDVLPVVPAPPTTPAPRTPSRSRTLSIDPLVPSSAFDERFKDRLRAVNRAQEEEDANAAQTSPEGNEAGDDRILTREWHAPSGKRIAIPVRVEPKVYFAAERTFLSWLHFAIYIGTIATTLLNFIPPDDERGLLCAALFTFTALLAIVYSAAIFVYRTLHLRKRRAEGVYYDKYGPTILCVVLLAALATNLVLRLFDMAED
ncbi:SPX-domain-containing protein [Russula ochroleuca]|jgi:SPX domain protein involved in polyphosphate accumulation|uniref:Vacuolar transporter chaperone complex subunit 4 n=1 Tax=Russula ochroleuca TaxID=152965 RepID=A0A9P5N4M5_9AGAM|nr:SPX-domain-containing protein [Russula ochroleuca]